MHMIIMKQFNFDDTRVNQFVRLVWMGTIVFTFTQNGNFIFLSDDKERKKNNRKRKNYFNNRAIPWRDEKDSN